MSKKAPGTSGLMPTRGSGCGIRPNAEALDTLEQGNGIDFTRAKELLDHPKNSSNETKNKDKDSVN
jgi:hypothetical protein